MAIDHPSATGRKRGRPSKAEIKMSLVAKRLAMLQKDDDDDDDDILPVAVENSRHCQRYKRMKVINDDESSEDEEIIVQVDPKKKNRAEKNNDSLDHKASDNPRKCKSKKQDFMDDLSLKSPVIKKAEEVQANLSDKYPSFVKPMLRSHVTHGFWLGLPKKFCDEHLPSHDCTIVLIDEHGRESDTKFLSQKVGLSAGWRGFSIEHNLQEGDAVVFQLISPTTFKLSIVRADDPGEVDASPKQWTSEDTIENSGEKEEIPILLEDNVQGNSDISVEHELVDGIRFSDTVISFENVNSFDSFKIVIDGLIIDSKFSENVRKRYYDLCLSRGSFLHENLLRGLNISLVSGIISETINIADAIKACNSSTSHEDILIWEKTLKGFELLGMNVSFLFARIKLLLGGAGSELKKLREARVEHDRASERMMALGAKLMELKENMKEIDLELKEEVNAGARERELYIKDIAKTPCPW